MGIVDKLAKVQERLVLRRNALFQVPLGKQMSFLNKLPQPKDDIQRGYCQYKCQAMLRGRFRSALLNIAVLPVALFLILKFRNAERPEKDRKADAVFFRDGKPANILPDSLLRQFPDCVSDPKEGYLLQKADLALIREMIRRFPLAWEFITKSTIKIARYRYAIERYHPQALLVCNEYSFTSSVLTEFCTRNHVELVNVMHGEKLYHIRDSFFRFHRCFVWSSHYVEMFENMRAAKDQFVVELPESLRFHVTEIPEKCFDYTYYMGAENREEMKTVCRMLENLQSQGMKMNIRPHPRYTDMQALRENCGTVPVENFRETAIEISVLRSRAVISQFSTVLFQAYCNGVSVVIDDITNPTHFSKLKELGFIMLNLEHRLLSELERK